MSREITAQWLQIFSLLLMIAGVLLKASCGKCATHGYYTQTYYPWQKKWDEKREIIERATTLGWNSTQPAGRLVFPLIGQDCVTSVVALLCIGHPSQDVHLCVCVCVCVSLTCLVLHLCFLLTYSQLLPFLALVLISTSQPSWPVFIRF